MIVHELQLIDDTIFLMFFFVLFLLGHQLYQYYTFIIELQLIFPKMSTISVCVRVRPLLATEKTQRNQPNRIILQEELKQIKVELTEQKDKFFKFNNIFGQQTSQAEVYAGVQALALVQRVVEGYHSTIFAYGQTGSGKTYTIDGSDSLQSQGIAPKTIRDLFRLVDERSSSDRGYKVFLSFLQIYNESIFDLIDISDGKPLRMRWNKYQQFTVENIFQSQCRNAEQALRWWRKGLKNKILGSHKMNHASSRSHCLLTLRVQSFLLEDPSQMIESKLQIVDLAGSERQRVTKSTGVVFREGIEINKSLFTLRQVIASLYETSTTGKPGIIPPYRDSKLTSLLKQSIGACLNPTMTHFEQSLQTLTYASMASYISNVPTKNIDPKIQQNSQLKSQNIQLRQQIQKLQTHIQYLTKLLQSNTCVQCRKKDNPSTLRKTENSSKSNVDKDESAEPTGLVQLNRLKQKSLLSIHVNQLPALPSYPSEKHSDKTVKERNVSSTVRPLKSTKQIFESIAMIRDLISANSTLRDKIQFLKQQVDKQQKETFVLMKENQVLRDRWEMISGTIKPESQIIEEEAPISRLERMVRQQRGEGLRLNSTNSQSMKAETEGQYGHKISYNQFLRGRKGIKQREKKQIRHKNRVHSQSKRVNPDAMYI